MSVFDIPKVPERIIANRFIRKSKTPDSTFIRNIMWGNYEMDIMKIRKHRITEFEIKSNPVGMYYDLNSKKDKHSEIQAGGICNYFYFICPDYYKLNFEIPSKYGIITYCPYGNTGFKFRIEREALLLHNRKINISQYADILHKSSIKIIN